MAHSRTCDETFEELLHKQKRNVKKTKRKKEDISLKKNKKQTPGLIPIPKPKFELCESCGSLWRR